LPKKERITDEEIIKDIQNVIRAPERDTETEYQKSTFLSFLLAIALIAATIVCAVWVPWAILLLIPFLIGYIVFINLRIRHKVKKVRIENYEVTTATLLYSVDESHWEEQVSRRGNRRRVWISYYVLRFEEFGYWLIPEDNYLWSGELPMGDGYIYENSHRGDKFIVVIEKKTKRIVVAYHTDLFEYKGERLDILEEKSNE